MDDKPCLRDRWLREQVPHYDRWCHVPYDQRHVLKKDKVVRAFILTAGSTCVYMKEFTMGTDIYLAPNYNSVTEECYNRKGDVTKYYVSDLFNCEVWMMYVYE